MSGLWVLLGVLAAATAVGVVRRRREGRVRVVPATSAGTGPTAPAAGAGDAAGDEPGAPGRALTALGVHPAAAAVTLVQFSSAFCAPCRATRLVLADVAASVAGVRHVEVDAESHLDAVRALGVLRTPTTLVVDSRGRVVRRASGPPRREQVLAAVAQVIAADGGGAG